MNPTEALTAIANGSLDAHLDALSRAIKARRQFRATLEVATLAPGDRVRIGGTRPAYLNGQHAIVQSVNDKTVSVRFENPSAAGRFGSSTVRVPVACITAA
jgi:ribosomal protein S17